jgi:hypothetical protein
LIEVEVKATLPRSQPEVEREETDWHLEPIPPCPANLEIHQPARLFAQVR